jgi:hypothetical protein
MLCFSPRAEKLRAAARKSALGHQAPFGVAQPHIARSIKFGAGYDLAPCYGETMCNRARFKGEPEAIFGAAHKLFCEQPRDNRFNPQELRPKGRAYVIRERESGERGWDIMSWDVLGGKAPYPMTNVRNLNLPQWRKLAEKPENRCLIPLTEFCEFTRKSMTSAMERIRLRARCGSRSQINQCLLLPASGRGRMTETLLPW